MDSIMDIARRRDLKVVEDCAHAIETQYHGQKVGTIGDVGCFSFYVTKNVVTGEGGMVLTNNSEYASFTKTVALHGMTTDAWNRFGDAGYKHYAVVFAGYKYNMTDMQAAIGIHQLPRVELYWKRRNEVWQAYNKAFGGLRVFAPEPVEPNTKHAFHLYTMLLDINNLHLSRDEFLDEMTKRNIGVGVHYVALHLHPYYKQTFNYKTGDFPNAEWISDRTVSLPLSAKLTDQDIHDVIDAVTDILE
jgi:dTDP-4-amino-4,6-dideoxygalactose transaminase